MQEPLLKENTFELSDQRRTWQLMPDELWILVASCLPYTNKLAFCLISRQCNWASNSYYVRKINTLFKGSTYTISFPTEKNISFDRVNQLFIHNLLLALKPKHSKEQALLKNMLPNKLKRAAKQYQIKMKDYEKMGGELPDFDSLYKAASKAIKTFYACFLGTLMLEIALEIPLLLLFQNNSQLLMIIGLIDVGLANGAAIGGTTYATLSEHILPAIHAFKDKKKKEKTTETVFKRTLFDMLESLKPPGEIKQVSQPNNDDIQSEESTENSDYQRASFV